MPFINSNLLTRAHKESTYDVAYQADVLSRYASIQGNHNHSTSILDNLTELLTSQLNSDEHALTSVVVFGSYARLDASPESDLDNLVLTTSEQPTSTNEARDVLSTLLADRSIPLPNARGVFGDGVYAASSLETGIGGVEDDYNSMSRRLLLLLESRPIFRPAVHDSVVERLVRLYGRDVEGDPRKNYVFLLNDLIRYFRTICVNYHHTKETEVEKWPIRNIKLRHSRLVMYASLVAMLGVLSTYRENDKNERLREFIRLTPLQRLHRAYLEVGPFYIENRIRWIECRPGNEGFDRITGLHRACWGALSESDCAPVTSRVGAFEGDNYRPHMTLDWENERIHVPSPSVVKERLKVSATFVAWAILQYSNDPLRRGVRVMKTREFLV